MQDIRNIAIIAHVDHGKTTLVDRMIYQANLVRRPEDLGNLILDNNDLERERGITILAKNVSVTYKGGKLCSGSPSARTHRMWSRFPRAIKVSISRMHHRDSRSFGEQITISHSLLFSASSMSPPRSAERGSSSWSRNTRPIFVTPVAFFTEAGSLKVSMAVCSFLAISASGEMCL